jgi:hypothetical protein
MPCWSSASLPRRGVALARDAQRRCRRRAARPQRGLEAGPPDAADDWLRARSRLLFGCLMSYVSSAQQVFVDVFHLGNGFPLAFGAVASLMAIASVTNANLVERLGMRRLSQTALTGFAGLSILLAGAAAAGTATLPLFLAGMGGLFFLFGLVAPNFNCARHGAAGPQRRPCLVHHRFRDDRSGRSVRRSCRPPVRRYCAAANARLL